MQPAPKMAQIYLPKHVTDAINPQTTRIISDLMGGLMALAPCETVQNRNTPLRFGAQSDYGVSAPEFLRHPNHVNRRSHLGYGSKYVRTEHETHATDTTVKMWLPWVGRAYV